MCQSLEKSCVKMCQNGYLAMCQNVSNHGQACPTPELFYLEYRVFMIFLTIITDFKEVDTWSYEVFCSLPFLFMIKVILGIQAVNLSWFTAVTSNLHCSWIKFTQQLRLALSISWRRSLGSLYRHLFPHVLWMKLFVTKYSRPLLFLCNPFFAERHIIISMVSNIRWIICQGVLPHHCKHAAIIWRISGAVIFIREEIYAK